MVAETESSAKPDDILRGTPMPLRAVKVVAVVLAGAGCTSSGAPARPDAGVGAGPGRACLAPAAPTEVARGLVMAPRLAYSGSQFGVVYLELADATRAKLRLARLSAAGALLGTSDVAADVLVHQALGGASRPGIAPAGDGFLVAYATAGPSLVLRRIAADGTPGGLTTAPGPTAPPSLILPTAGEGRFLITWLEGGGPRPGRYMIAGADLTTVRGPTPLGGEKALYFAAARAGTGFVTAWFDTEMHVARIEGTGGIFGERSYGASSGIPDIAAGEAGYGVVASGEAGITFRALSPSLQPTGEPLPLDARKHLPSIAWTGARFVVAYPAAGVIRIRTVQAGAAPGEAIDLPADPWDDLGFPDAATGAGGAVGVVFPQAIDRASNVYAIDFAAVTCP
jgi:hypothetical protein